MTPREAGMRQGDNSANTSVLLGRRLASSLLRSSISVGTALIVGIFCVPAVHAHDVVLHSKPADGGVVSTFPTRIELEFSGIPQPQFNTVAVTNTDTGAVLFRGTPTLDKQFVRIAVPSDVHPEPGNYIVGFQITSSDGHATRGKTTFAFDDKGGTQTRATSASERDPAGSTKQVNSNNESSRLPLAAFGVAVLVILIAAAIALAARKRRGSSNPPIDNSTKKGL